MMHFERGNWLFDFREDYSQFFSNDNWFTYRLIHIEFENDAIQCGASYVAGQGFFLNDCGTATFTRTNLVVGSTGILDTTTLALTGATRTANLGTHGSEVS